MNKEDDVNVILTDKGGLGKSLVASVMAQAADRKNIPMRLASVDPGQCTLGQWFPGTEDWKVMAKVGGVLELRHEELNAAIGSLENDHRSTLIDTGSSTTAAVFRAHCEQFGLDSVLADMGKRVFVHTIVSGGGDYKETVGSLVDNMKSFACTNTKFVVWLNEYGGVPQDANGIPFIETAGFKAIQGRVSSVITMKQLPGATTAELKKTLHEKLTLKRLLELMPTDTRFNFLTRGAAEKFYLPLFAQLESVEF
jgi:hypothetical protein